MIREPPKDDVVAVILLLDTQAVTANCRFFYYWQEFIGTRPNINPTFVMSSEETPTQKTEEIAPKGQAESYCTHSRAPPKGSSRLEEDFSTSSDGESSLHHDLTITYKTLSR